jgi:hypothetical protein
VSTNQFSNVPRLSWLEVTVRCPDASAVQVVVANARGPLPGAGVYTVCSEAWPDGVAPPSASVKDVVADPAAGVIES